MMPGLSYHASIRQLRVDMTLEAFQNVWLAKENFPGIWLRGGQKINEFFSEELFQVKSTLSDIFQLLTKGFDKQIALPR